MPTHACLDGIESDNYSWWEQPQDPLFLQSHRQFEKTIAQTVTEQLDHASSKASEETKA